MEISVNQMMQIEEHGHKMGFHRRFMMENAGSSVARYINSKFGGYSKKSVLICAGMGNNGGDAFVVARHLAGYDSFDVNLMLLGSNDKIKTEESKQNWDIIEKMNSVNKKMMPDESYLPADFSNYEIIVDGILGTGISGKVKEPYASTIERIDESDAFKVAVDVPSGLDPDSGKTADKYVRCNTTITFHRTKKGMSAAKDICGDIITEKIGIPPEAEEGIL